MLETAAIYAFIIANEAIIVLVMQGLCFFIGTMICILATQIALDYLVIALTALYQAVAESLRHVLSGLPKYDVQPNPEVNWPVVEPSLDLEADLLEEPEPVLPEYVDADNYQPEYEPPPYSGKASSLNIVYTINKKWSAYQQEKQISKIFDLPAYEDVEGNVVISPGGN